MKLDLRKRVRAVMRAVRAGKPLSGLLAGMVATTAVAGTTNSVPESQRSNAEGESSAGRALSGEPLAPSNFDDFRTTGIVAPCDMRIPRRSRLSAATSAAKKGKSASARKKTKVRKQPNKANEKKEVFVTDGELPRGK